MKYEKILRFDYRNGAPISDGEIDEWHKQVFDNLSTGKSKFHSINSGNSMITGEIFDDGTILIREIRNGFIEHQYKPVKPPKEEA